MKSLPEISLIDVELIMGFISRARAKAGFDEMKENIRQIGVKMPVGLREVSHLPAAERKRPDGGHYRYQRIWGQGRIEAVRDLGLKKIPAFVFKHDDVKESDIVGMFLNENMIRKPLPWAEKARLVRDEVDGGASKEEVAARFGVTVMHVNKFLRIMSATANGIERDVAAMPMNDAEVLTTMPAEEQAIVVEALRENPERQARDVLRKAKQIADEGRALSTVAIRETLKRVDDDLSALRKSMRVTRLHHSLGPQNLLELLKKPKFRDALKAARVNIGKFEELCQP